MVFLGAEMYVDAVVVTFRDGNEIGATTRHKQDIFELEIRGGVSLSTSDKLDWTFNRRFHDVLASGKD